MNGTTLHSGADLPRPQAHGQESPATDIDNLFTKNQALRWIIIDEISMVSDRLLSQAEQNLRAASSSTRRRRGQGSGRIFGGYNVLVFGDWWQLPPIPGSRALFLPPCTWLDLDGLPFRANECNSNTEEPAQPGNHTSASQADRSGACKSSADKTVLNMFWYPGPDSLNFLSELVEQKRTSDSWFSSVLMECREGCLSAESYCFLTGLPTAHTGTWEAQGGAMCGKSQCAALVDL